MGPTLAPPLDFCLYHPLPLDFQGVFNTSTPGFFAFLTPLPWIFQGSHPPPPMYRK